MKLFQKIKLGAKRNAPVILGVASVIGLATTTYLTVKAVRAIDDMRDDGEIKEEDIPEVIKKAAPAAVSFATTAACMIGCTVSGRAQYNSLLGTTLFLQNRLYEYRAAAVEQNLDGQITDHIMEQKLENGAKIYRSHNIKNPDDVRLYYDSISGMYFECDEATVLRAQANVNKGIVTDGFYRVHDYLNDLGINFHSLDISDDTGWDCDLVYGYFGGWVDWQENSHIATINDDLEVMILSPNCYPGCIDPDFLKGYYGE